SIAGAEMRLQMAEEKLAQAEESHSDEQKNILVAAVEAARQKLEQAKGRLADHMKEHSIQEPNGEQVD
ncbi:MAG: hypothetical protein ACPGN5_00935, partial [Porticoccaceae bacterium]